MIKSGRGAELFVADAGCRTYVVLLVVNVALCTLDFQLCEIEQEIQVSWCHGSSPGTDCEDCQ